MENGYKIETKYTSHDPEKINKFLGGDSLFKVIGDLLEDVKGKHSFVSNPLEDMEHSHFDMANPIVIDFMSSGGPEGLGKILKCSPEERITRLSNLLNRFTSIKTASQRNILRYSYMALQNFIDKNNSAAKFERLAYKNNEKSSGHWQLEALKGIDDLMNFADEN